MSLLAIALALGEHGAVHIAQRNLDDQQAGSDTLSMRHFFPSGKQESTGWTGLLQSSTADHSAAPLLITDGTEKAFCDALQTVIVVPSRGSKVICYQQRVLGMECQRLQRICCRSEISGKMRGVHGRPEVLLADCGQGGLEYASLPGEKHTEISFAEWRSIDRSEQREADPIRGERQTS